MNLKPLIKGLITVFLMVTAPVTLLAQQKTITGKVTNEKGEAIAGSSVLAKGTKTGTQTAADGTFTISVPESASKLVVSSVGYAEEEVAIKGLTSVTVSLKSSSDQLATFVVVGYGTVRKKDLTGSVASVSAKDFNKGNQTSPDQLIQGKVTGVQVIANSGAPGAATTIRIRGASSIRGGNTPLFVVDGVQLDNRSARPGNGIPDLGNTPDGNPLNFINPADIASIEVLKDASAAAIYGSRGANGVVLITTKRGQTGAPKLDFSLSYGSTNILKKLKVLSGSEYRAALTKFGLGTNNDYGSDVNALDAITRTGKITNASIGMSGGNENGRYRLSLGYLNQDGFIRKTDFNKVNVAFTSSFKFLDSKKLGLDFNVIMSQTGENIAPITNNAGFKGSLIGQALQWNPTKSIYNASGALNIKKGSDQINPMAMSEAYNDYAKVSNAIFSIAPYYKITNDLEYKVQYSANYSTGNRKSYISNWINITGVERDSASGIRGGVASIAESELMTQQLTHTLSYTKDLNQHVSVNAVVGYEFQRFNARGSYQGGKNFDNFGTLPYYNYMQFVSPQNRSGSSYADPLRDLQSYFARGIFNINDKYLLTATFRADGSSKFGANHKYGYFPSFAGAWNLSKESFMSSFNTLRDIKVRASWGVTGNQEFPTGASQGIYTIGQESITKYSVQNPDLVWESTNTLNFGTDFTVAKKINVTIDYFKRTTNDLVFPRGTADPVPVGSSITWSNIPGNINNSGFEFAFSGNAIQKKDFSLDFGLNLSLLKNKLTDFILTIPTGEISGSGLTGAYSQLLINNQPLNVFYLKKYLGIDKATGVSIYQGGDAKLYSGSPNPSTLLGFSAKASYKKLNVELNFNGAFGHMIYNNTANAVLGLKNLASDRNVASNYYDEAVSFGETLSNYVCASTRYLEKGDYLKLANATASYNIGAIGKVAKSANIYITGQNLLVFTKYSGFDPEVNTNKQIGEVPSFGIEHTPYPSARTITLGLNFSF
jgi:iron complex outermembrane receptor protein